MKLALIAVKLSLITLPLVLSELLVPHYSQFEKSCFICAYEIIYAYLGSIITGNYSQVDEIWSVSPMLYAWVLRQSGTRGLLVFGLVFAWGFRLTLNFCRRGGFQGEEDYRWAVLRKKIPNPVLWQLFNIGFICIIQNILIMAFTLPVHYVPPGDCEQLDLVFGGVTLFFLGFETLADQQQWNFQTKKYELINKKVEMQPYYSRGFCTSGLFKYSRHPNFFAEQLIWWSLYLFTRGLNVSIVGPAALSLLFHFSTDFTEEITLSKYPQYKVYQQRTSRLIPWFCSEKPSFNP